MKQYLLQLENCTKKELYQVLIFSISLIRAIGCLAVIVLHVSDPLVYHSESLSNEWWLGYFFNSMTRFSVPIFIMASGALILTRLEDQPNINFISFYKMFLKIVRLVDTLLDVVMMVKEFLDN